MKKVTTKLMIKALINKSVHHTPAFKSRIAHIISVYFAITYCKKTCKNWKFRLDFNFL